MSDLESILDNISRLYRKIDGFQQFSKNRIVYSYWLFVDGELFAGGISPDNIDRLTDADSILRAERKYREINHLPHRSSQDKYKEFART